MFSGGREMVYWERMDEVETNKAFGGRSTLRLMFFAAFCGAILASSTLMCLTVFFLYANCSHTSGALLPKSYFCDSRRRFFVNVSENE